MMPYCAYRRCKRVANRVLGEIITGDRTSNVARWTERVYVCDKHYFKLLKLMGQRFNDED